VKRLHFNEKKNSPLLMYEVQIYEKNVLLPILLLKSFTLWHRSESEREKKLNYELQSAFLQMNIPALSFEH
jgi:hypothetical protein